MKRFFVFAEPRSGTTFLRHCLNAHPEIHLFGEVLPGIEGEASFHGYWLERIARDPSDILLEKVPMVFHEFLSGLFSGREEPAVGFDMKYYQLEWKPDLLAVLDMMDFHVIHVIRTNILKRYVSLLLHEPETRALIDRDQHTAARLAPVLIRVPDVESLPGLLEEYARRMQAFESAISSHLPYLFLTYEDMIDRQANYLTAETQKKVFDFLDVGPLAEMPTMAMRKMNPDKLRYSVLNYHEVVAALAATGFADMLDDPQWDMEHAAFHERMYQGHMAMENDPAQALKHYLLASAMDPDDAEPYYQMAIIHAALLRRDKMGEMFDRAMELCTDERVRRVYADSRTTLEQTMDAS